MAKSEKRLLKEDFSFYDHAMKRLNNMSLSDTNDDFALNIFWCRYIRHTGVSEKEGRVRLHSHSFYELHCILSGNYSYMQADGKHESVGAGEFFIIAPHVRHCTENVDPCGETFALTFEIKESDSCKIGRLIAAMSGMESRRGKISAEELQIIEIIMNELYNAGVLCSQTVRALLLVLVTKLMSDLLFTDINVSSGPELPVAVYDRRLEELEKYMLDNSEVLFSVSDLAKYINIGTKQLNNIVKRDIGITAKLFIDRVKCNCARKLLLETDMSIYEISCGLGFTDCNNFNRFFKRVEGISPGLFRQSKG